MSRSVSAPSSVTNTSPCWNGLIVPGSTLRYGSNFCACTRRPRAFNSRPSDAATIPLPRAETTPPVTKTYFVGRVAELTGQPLAYEQAKGRRGKPGGFPSAESAVPAKPPPPPQRHRKRRLGPQPARRSQRRGG